MPVSVNQPLTVIAVWQALYRHSKSPHSSPFIFILCGEIIIIIIIIIDIATVFQSMLNEIVIGS